MGKGKYNQEFVENFLENIGCELISEYKDVKSPITYKCSCGEVSKSSFDRFINANQKGCKNCVGERINVHNKLSHDYVKNYFEEQGCVLLDEDYVDSKTKMSYICVCNRESTITWNRFKKGQRCKECSKEKNTIRSMTPIEEVIQFFSNIGFKLLDKEYKGSSKKLYYQCSCGNTVSRTFNQIKNHPKCTCESLQSIRYDITDEEMIDGFWQLYNRLGKCPTLRDIEGDNSLPHAGLYKIRLGKYSDFLTSLDLMGANGWLKEDEQKLVKHLEKDGVNKTKKLLSWNRSVKAIKEKASELNLTIKEENVNKKYLKSKEEVVNIVREYCSNYQKTPTLKILIENTELIQNDIIRNFGGYTNLLIELGLKEKSLKKKSEVKIDFPIEEIYEDYTKGLSYKELSERYSYGEYKIISEFKKHGKEFRNKRWSKEQLKYLNENYAQEDWDVLVMNLSPFTKEEIYHKAYKLNLKREGFKWTKEQEDFLIDNYAKLDLEELSDKLNKSHSAIATKANKLGVKIREYWDEEELERFKKMYPFHTNEELLNFFPKRTPSSIMSTAGILGIYKDKDFLKDSLDKKMKKELIERLVDFSEQIKRTPTLKEITRNPNMNGAITYVRYFGSYAEACRQAGIPVNASLFGNSFHTESINGDLCLSMKEKLITDLLIINNINYEKEKAYKKILNDDSLKNIRCDWYLSETKVVVEYFGMADRQDYRKRMNEKINLCKINNIPLIDLYEKDIDRDYKGLIEKFAQHNINIII